MVTVPSAAILTQALIVLSFASCEKAGSITMQKAIPPVAFKKSLRSMSGLLCGLLDGGDDAGVGAAAADVAVHVTEDLVAARAFVRGEELGGLHDLARLAVAALRHGLVDPRLLQRMRGGGREAFDRGHALAFRRGD